mmetsp:Transcript_67050/g.178851  ORF Transcript_67050/g.178851 Transcript_67050/m.178851 type:complete len:201 (+) Transcript_67050:813-1415(+)
MHILRPNLALGHPIASIHQLRHRYHTRIPSLLGLARRPRSAHDLQSLGQLVQVDPHLLQPPPEFRVRNVLLELPLLDESGMTLLGLVDEFEGLVQLLQLSAHLDLLLGRPVLFDEGRMTEDVVDDESVHDLHQAEGREGHEHDEKNLPSPIHLRQHVGDLRPAFQRHDLKQSEHCPQEGAEQVLHRRLPCLSGLFWRQCP